MESKLDRISSKKSKHEVYVVDGEGAVYYERLLQKLCSIGYLETPFTKPNNWEKQSVIALKEFLELHGHSNNSNYHVNVNVLDDIENTAYKNTFAIHVLNYDDNKNQGKDQSSPSTGENPSEFKLPNSKGFYHVGRTEPLIVRVSRYIPEKAAFIIRILVKAGDGQGDDKLGKIDKKKIIEFVAGLEGKKNIDSKDDNPYKLQSIMEKKIDLESDEKDVDLGRIYDISEENKKLFTNFPQREGLLICYTPHPKKKDKILARVVKIGITALCNVEYISDDQGSEYLVSKKIFPQVSELKKKLHEKGKLITNQNHQQNLQFILSSTIRTSSKQMDLWYKYVTKDPSQKNPAAQPGMSLHETGHALDFGYLQLQLVDYKNEKYNFDTLPDFVVNKKFDTEYDRKVGKYYLDNLDEFRKIVYDLGFDPCNGKKEWEERPWNDGYGRFRKWAKISAAAYEDNKKVILWFDVNETDPYISDSITINSNFKATLSLEGGHDLKFTYAKSEVEIPKRCYSGSNPEEKSSDSDTRTRIEWVIDEKTLSKMLVSNKIENDFKKLSGSSLVIKWTEKKKNYEIEATEIKIEHGIDASLINLEFNLKEGQFDNKNKVLYDKYCYFIGSIDVSPSEVNIDTDKAIPLSPTKRIDPNKAILQVKKRDVGAALNSKDIEPEHLIGKYFCVIIEDQSVIEAPQWLKIAEERREHPAFHAAASEKHHYEVPLSQAGLSSNVSDIHKNIEGLNDVIQAYNDKLDAIIGNIENTNKLNKNQKNVYVMKIRPLRWRKYPKGSETLKAADYIGNFPDKKIIEDMLKALSDKQENIYKEYEPIKEPLIK